jgi:hypothetical protein
MGAAIGEGRKDLPVLLDFALFDALARHLGSAEPEGWEVLEGREVFGGGNQTVTSRIEERWYAATLAVAAES